MGTLKTTNIQTITGSGTLTLGTSGETITVPNGAFSGQNYPGFMVNLSSNQTVSTGTWTKLNFSDAVLNEGSDFDTSTNYRFTVSKAGKYVFVFQSYRGYGANGTSMRAGIYKNGSLFEQAITTDGAGIAHTATCQMIDNCSVGDYYEAYVYHVKGSNEIYGTNYNNFYGYRIGT